MKGLLKYLSPFAPDQSGAAAVFYDCDCITVVCDAGGCIGNYCGFDEPRWFDHKSPIFSAGLRDMDAILGRDDHLIGKLDLVAGKFGSRFAALIGTPVPAVIGTDYKALKRMSEKKCGIPVLGIECSGTGNYDAGASEAYLQLFSRFAQDVDSDLTGNSSERILGIIGATPLDTSDTCADRKLREFYAKDYDRIYCYGMGDGLDAVERAGTVSKNIVVAPSGIMAAEYLKERFGTPYETAYPLPLPKVDLTGVKKMLIIHQQVAANELRKQVGSDVEVCVATFFMQDPSCKQDSDQTIDTEEALRDLILNGNFDLVVADAGLQKAVRSYTGKWIDFPHFAVSGSLVD